MRYQLLGRTGLRVSEMCLGAMTFGEAWGWGAGKDECARILGTYREAGGNFVDTANIYTDGESERIPNATGGCWPRSTSSAPTRPTRTRAARTART
jgi:aryl-alcohol dehydrogenase-like predicted oxidoreductase